VPALAADAAEAAEAGEESGVVYVVGGASECACPWSTTGPPTAASVVGRESVGILAGAGAVAGALAEPVALTVPAAFRAPVVVAVALPVPLAVAVAEPTAVAVPAAVAGAWVAWARLRRARAARASFARVNDPEKLSPHPLPPLRPPWCCRVGRGQGRCSHHLGRG